MPITQQLIDYIQKARASGLSDDAIREQLVKAGWSPDDVKAAVVPPVAPAPIPIPVQQSVPPPQISVSGTPPVVASFVSSSFPRKTFLMTLAVMVVVLAVGGVGYAYFKSLGPFGTAPYTEKNLISGLLEKTSSLTSSTYLLSADFSVGPRDAGARPFVSKSSGGADFEIRYKNDYQRAQDVTGIFRLVSPPAPNTSGFASYRYPTSLDKALTSNKARNDYYYGPVSLKDPASGQSYGYVLTENGSNFELTVLFETDEAIRVISEQDGFDPKRTIITGRSVTFTAGSQAYLYLPSAPPVPFFVAWSDMVRYLSPEFSAGGSVGGTTDLEKNGSEWKFTADAHGDFGDLSYAFSADALKKDANYYFRINKIPSLFAGYFGSIKGQWVKIDPQALANAPLGQYDELSYLAREFPEYEKDYKETRAENVAPLKKAAQLADEEGLFQLKNPPRKRALNGRTVYTYDLKIKKEAIVPFYKKLLDEFAKIPRYSPVVDKSNRAYIEYFESQEFSEMFDYYNESTTFSVSVDTDGLPAEVAYTLRIIPPDTALPLKDKQANFVVTLNFFDLNKPVLIEAPADAKPVEKLIEEMSANAAGSIEAAHDSRRKADLDGITLGLQLYYDAHETYPASIGSLIPTYLANVPVDPVTKVQYFYNPYQKFNWTSVDVPAQTCSTPSSCMGYHLGANLEKADSSFLRGDADINSTVSRGIRGGDKGDCSGNKGSGKYCLDLRNR